MPTFNIAHLREQGDDVVIIPLEDSFDYRSDQDRHNARLEFQARSANAGLRGDVVLVWNSGGRMKFIAPPNWLSFFQGASMDWVQANVNKTLSW